MSEGGMYFSRILCYPFVTLGSGEGGASDERPEIL